MNRKAPAILIESLSFAYPRGQPALQAVSLCVEAGEKVALIGPNGAGKSTLLLHLNGLLIGQGRVLIHGIPVQPETLRRIRALVGLIFQSPDDQLFCSTVYEDVAYGPVYQGLPLPEVQERVVEALQAVSMIAHVERSPARLSLGEKKRVALATVLAMRPSILALDEPTAGLDPRGRRELIALLQRLPQTMVVATHDLDLARQLLPRTVILDGGLVVADGPTERILGDTALLEQHGLA